MACKVCCLAPPDTVCLAAKNRQGKATLSRATPALFAEFEGLRCSMALRLMYFHLKLISGIPAQR